MDSLEGEKRFLYEKVKIELTGRVIFRSFSIFIGGKCKIMWYTKPVFLATKMLLVCFSMIPPVFVQIK